MSSSVLAPSRAAASAASQPAWPAPTTTTSYCSSWSQLAGEGAGAGPAAAAAAATGAVADAGADAAAGDPAAAAPPVAAALSALDADATTCREEEGVG